jgi:hypothetical protein
MKKVVTAKNVARFQRLIIDASNLMNCVETTGISPQTIKKIISTGFAKEDNIKKLVDYCNEVETVKA